MLICLPIVLLRIPILDHPFLENAKTAFCLLLLLPFLPLLSFVLDLEYRAVFDQKNDSHLLYYFRCVSACTCVVLLLLLLGWVFLTFVLGKLLYLCRLYMYLTRWCAQILSLLVMPLSMQSGVSVL